MIALLPPKNLSDLIDRTAVADVMTDHRVHPDDHVVAYQL